MKYAGFACCLFLVLCVQRGLCGNDTLSGAAYGFEHVQDSTRTKVWWFHGETETTRAGITADLEAFRRAGVGGVVYYDQVHSKSPVAFDAFSAQWWEMLRFSVQEARRLGLSFECHVSNGYVAGGPWITEELGMQRLAATDTLLHGGRRFSGKLPEPKGRYGFFRDVAVLAFPVTRSQWMTSRDVPLAVSSNVGSLAAAAFTSDNLVRIPARPSGKAVFLDLDFGGDFTARSISYQVRPRGKSTTSATNVPAPPGDVFVGTGYRVLPDLGELEVSEDGRNYKKVCALKPVYKAHSSWQQKTISFPAAKGRYFRLNLHDWHTEGDGRADMQIGDIVLSPRAKVDQWEEKAGLFSEYVEKDLTPAYGREEVIDPGQIVDLTHLLRPDGSLAWDVPEGEWVVMRFAHVPTGGKTKHGRSNLMGLECDKMSPAAAKVQWDNYCKVIIDSLSRHDLRLDGIAMDSHEAGSQNWTPGFEKEFRTRRGYDLRRFLPVMSGYVVGTSEESKGVLYDVRRTIADLIADNYYGTFDRLCREEGLGFTAQATGNALCIVADPIQAKGRVLTPQGEFWAIHPDGNYDIKESSSAAHLYGKGIASAEAFTDAKYSQSPAYLKTLADNAYCYGINEFVACASAYQPWLDKVPGNTGGGRHYCLNRNNTFWEYSKPFWDYQSRCAYLMRQGTPVVDVCVYLGENAPVKILTHRLPELPGGVDFDAFTSDALFKRMDTQSGNIVLPDGMTYRMMILPRNGEVTLDALKRIASFIERGAAVYGAKPVCSGAFKDISAKEEYRALADSVWGKENLREGTRRYGKGTVYWGMSPGEALAMAGVEADVKTAKEDMKRSRIWFAHRKLEDADIYFLYNHGDAEVADTFSFRSGGKVAELWNPVTGSRHSLPSAVPGGQAVSLPLKMAPKESFFVVIADRETENLPALTFGGSRRDVKIEGPWTVCFDPAKGGPGEVVFDELTDWTRHPCESVRFYSGTAVYRKEMEIRPAEEGKHLSLRFSGLGSVARVSVNGQEAGIVWCPPWEVDITRLVVPGTNKLEIYVANSLMNRMIGDAGLPAEQRVTSAFPAIASPGDKLVESGITGDLTLSYRD